MYKYKELAREAKDLQNLMQEYQDRKTDINPYIQSRYKEELVTTINVIKDYLAEIEKEVRQIEG